jgi:DNA-binding PadR family transcriptional regulator
MARRVDNLLALAVLGYLTQGPMHPYEIGTTLTRHGDDRSIRYRHASLYMVVERLAAAGFVVPVETGRDGARPERTRYAVTDAGRAELRDWLTELLAEPLAPEDVLSALERRAAALDDARADCLRVVERAAADGVHPLFLVEEEYRLALLDAESRFVGSLRARIGDPSSGWAAAWTPAPAPEGPR